MWQRSVLQDLHQTWADGEPSSVLDLGRLFKSAGMSLQRELVRQRAVAGEVLAALQHLSSRGFLQEQLTIAQIEALIDSAAVCRSCRCDRQSLFNCLCTLLGNFQMLSSDGVTITAISLDAYLQDNGLPSCALFKKSALRSQSGLLPALIRWPGNVLNVRFG
jgi:hypothetical protein